MPNPWYKDYAEFLAEKFPGQKLQKISVDAGFSCPNRDGTIGSGGCIYCNNASFTPAYCSPADSVAQQLRKGRAFFAKKYPQMRYLAYFQSFTGTHSSSTAQLESLYSEALAQPDVEGIIIGTRPDALPEAVLDLLADLNRQKPVMVELGAESAHNHTLQLVHRGHTWQNVEDACGQLAARNIDVGIHLIEGLPGESREDMLATLDKAMELPVSTLKFHHLQIIRNTPMHTMWRRGEVEIHPFGLEEYLDICVDIVRRVGHKKAIERFTASSPADMVEAPKWGLKNYQFTNLLHNKLRESEKSQSGLL